MNGTNRSVDELLDRLAVSRTGSKGRRPDYISTMISAAEGAKLIDYIDGLRSAADRVRNVPTGDDEGHEPTATSSPVEGVTLWNFGGGGAKGWGFAVKVDGEWAGSTAHCHDRYRTLAEMPFDGSSHEPRTASLEGFALDALRAFRDRIRADRAAAAAAKPAVVPWTFSTMPVAVKVRRKIDGHLTIAHVGGPAGAVIGGLPFSFDALLRDYEQLDGTPCGTPA